jgi:hypothetical protein
MQNNDKFLYPEKDSPVSTKKSKEEIDLRWYSPQRHAREMTAEFINEKGLWVCPAGISWRHPHQGPVVSQTYPSIFAYSIFEPSENIIN